MASSDDSPSALQRAGAAVRSLLRRRWFRRAALAAGVGFALAVVLFVIAYQMIDLPSAPEEVQTTVVLDAEGNVLAELFDVENRASVELDEVAPVMRHAVIAAEDRNFYEHNGLDPIALGRAFLNDVRGKRLQGGSTITQQLVKNTWLSPERSLVRKAKEAVLSMKVERSWSKEEILERYLNTVYFGRGAYGIEKASQAWFGIPAAQLQLHQAALLAGLIRAPETADPMTHAGVAEARRAHVLEAMVRTGAITREEADAAAAVPIQVKAKMPIEDQLTGSSAYFVDQVRAWLVRRYGEQTAFGGGLRVETTLRPTMQAAAEQAVLGRLGGPDDPDAALVSIDDRGAILAMIGGKSFAESKVNLALGEAGGGQGRQPGSTFKPFVLAAALEAGIPVTRRFPGPAQIDVEVDGVPFRDVDNFGNEAYPDLDLIEATAKSVNTIYAQLIAEVGPRPVARLATDLGVTAEIEPHPALALGSEEVSPLDLARAYMTFGNRGERITPFSVERVRDSSGAVIYTADVERESVYPRQYADLINHVLRGVIDHGTGRGARIGRPAAGKTGTTTDNADAWFVGYTPKVATAVWMGYKEGTDRKLQGVTGGSIPASIWRAFMRDALAGIETGEFEPPPSELLTPETTTTSSTTSSSTSSTSSTSSASSTSTTLDEDEETTTSTTEPGNGSTTTTTTEPPPEESTTTTVAGGASSDPYADDP